MNLFPPCFPRRRLMLALALLLGSSSGVFAALANAWHIPDNSGDLGGTHMRDPWIEISNDPASPTTVTIYEGIYKGDGANQTGGTLFYKGASQSVWSSTALGFDRNSGNNQYWKASFSTAGFAANEVIQYYIYLTTDGSAGIANTYIYAPVGTGDKGGVTTSVQATAAGSAFTVRNRPGWVFHADNRVVNGSSVQFWAKVGYIGDMNNVSTRWADNGAIYYTVDGTDAGAGCDAGNGRKCIHASRNFFLRSS